jgi:DnaJ domain
MLTIFHLRVYDTSHAEISITSLRFIKRSILCVVHTGKAMVARQVCYYRVLGLERGASEEEIRGQFRKLVKRCHPDRTEDPRSRKEFQRLHKAYKVLSDHERRMEYDKRRFGPIGAYGVDTHSPLSAHHALYQITRDTYAYQRVSRSVAIFSMTFILSAVLFAVLFP